MLQLWNIFILNDAVAAPSLFKLNSFIFTYSTIFPSLPLCVTFWFFPSLPPSSQRRSWIWTRASGRTSMSSQELWNFSSVSFLSRSCRTDSSPTSWRQSVSVSDGLFNNYVLMLPSSKHSKMPLKAFYRDNEQVHFSPGQLWFNVECINIKKWD